jgi:CO/xanthine dehydrogenase Mo-binding subunit
MGKWTRRAFIGAGTLVGGGFVLGVSGLALAPSRHSVVSDDAAETGELTTWITVTPDNFVTVLVPHCEMGQGTQTALAMMAAEEMDADWNLVRINEAPALDNYATAYMARPMMPVIPTPFVRGVDYGTYRLARWFGFQATGGSTAVRGTGVYGMTVAGAAAREMLVAAAAARFGVSASECKAASSRIMHAASGKSASFGELAKAAAKISVPTSPAVKDPGSYTIRRTARPRAVLALKPVFDDAGHGSVSSATIFAAFDTALGAAPELSAQAAQVITADYRVPFLAHATMEPMACTARVDGDHAEVWAGTQDPLNARSTAAKALKMNVENVHVTNLLLGGGFGRRLPFTFDYVDMAVRIAKAMSPTPVKLVWSRENDIQHDYYRPAGMARFAGALDANGAPLAIRSRYAGGGDGESVFMPYAIPDKHAEAKDAAHPIRLGAWRSVLNSQHGFFKESFVDELAHAAGKDPYLFRRDLLGDEPRFRAVLERVATMAGWGTPLPGGEGRGIALTESFGSIVGEVAHVAVAPDGTLRVKHVYAVVDCGDVVNPDSALAQVEGGIIFGLSAALVGEITIDAGRVVQRNFRDHQMIRLAAAPRITAEFIKTDRRPGGLGEPCVPPIAPAVANAIFAATGVRVRDLPIKNQPLVRNT